MVPGRSRSTGNFWHAYLLIVQRNPLRLLFAWISTIAQNCSRRLPMFTMSRTTMSTTTPFWFVCLASSAMCCETYSAWPTSLSPPRHTVRPPGSAETRAFNSTDGGVCQIFAIMWRPPQREYKSEVLRLKF